MNAIKIDWMEELKIPDKWENVGRRLIEEKCTQKCTHNSQSAEDINMQYSGYCEECGFSEDTAIPMMNYAYPLENWLDDDKILKIVNDTNLTIMLNTETEEYFLTLCGGGMNLSQDIALAYIIAYYGWLPADVAQLVKNKGITAGEK